MCYGNGLVCIGAGGTVADFIAAAYEKANGGVPFGIVMGRLKGKVQLGDTVLKEADLAQPFQDTDLRVRRLG